MPPIRNRNYYGLRKFRFRGTDWCGPGWSDGKWQSNRCGFATARSRFDQACKEHDCAIYNDGSTARADSDFARTVDNPLIGYAPMIAHSLENKLMQTPKSRQRYNSDSSVGSGFMSVSRAGSSYGNTNSFGPGSFRTVNFKGGVKPSHLGSRKKVNFFYEGGGLISETATIGQPISQVLYIGHGTYNRGRIERSIWSALVKKLFEKHGVDVPALDTAVLETPGSDTYRIHITGQEVGNATLTALDYGPFASVLQFADLICATTWPVKFHFKEMVLRLGSSTTVYKEVASINLERVVLHCGQYHKLTMQNVTAGDTGGLVTDSVGTNPLQLTKYSIKKANFSIANFTQEPDPLVSSTNLGKPNATQNFIGFYNQNGSFTLGQRSYLREPPTGSEVNDCSSVDKMILQPGASITSSVNYYSSYYLNTFYEGDISETSTQNTMGEYGKCVVFAVDKVVDTRAEQTAPKIAWQIEYGLSCHVSMKKISPTAYFKEVQIENYA